MIELIFKGTKRYYAWMAALLAVAALQSRTGRTQRSRGNLSLRERRAARGGRPLIETTDP